jgi:hypothetical protein
MRKLLALAVLAGCTDPVVEMEIVMPSQQTFDTSCINAVEIRVAGSDFLQDSDDHEEQCVELQGGASYAAIRDAMRGKFDIDITDTGISGIEIFGWSGPTACQISLAHDPYVSPDLLFYGHGGYIGQDRVEVPIAPNLNCARTNVNVRMYDMFALIGGATCDAAGTAVGEASVGNGTLVPRQVGKGSMWFGNLTGAVSTNNVATFAALTQAGSKSCLAFDGGSETWGGSTGCSVGGPSVCAGAGDIEHPIIPNSVLWRVENFDAQLMSKFPGVVFGSVWSNGATKTTVAGATVTVDSAHGKVIYLDAPNASGVLAARADQSGTGPSGLFALYTDTLVSAKITAGTATRIVTLGSADTTTAAAMIVMGP